MSPLYNLERLQSHPDHPVVVVKTPADADILQTFCNGIVFVSADLDSDVSPLNNRKAKVILWLEHFSYKMLGNKILNSPIYIIPLIAYVRENLVEFIKKNMKPWEDAPEDDPSEEELFEEEKPSESDNSEHKGLLPANVADEFLSQEGWAGNIRYWHGDFWLFNGKKYCPVTKEYYSSIIMWWLRGHYRSKAKTAFCNDVVANIISTCILKPDRQMPDWLDGVTPNPENFISFNNGLLNLNTKELQKHSSLFFSPTTLPYNYDPSATCPLWQEFLDHIQPDKDCQTLLKQWTGYCLKVNRNFQYFMILSGEGSNGKSVYLNILRALVGEENTSSVGLEDFNDKFAFENTIGKLINICADTGELEKTAEGKLKKYVGGDPVQVEPKYKPAFSIIPTIKLIFSTNNPPRFTDRSQGIWRRLLYIPFNVVIPLAEQRPFEEFTAELKTELPGIFIWAMEGLRQLTEEKAFIRPATMQLALDDYKTESNPAREFLTTNCISDPVEHVIFDNIYNAYKLWCKDYNYKSLHAKHFQKEIKRIFNIPLNREGQSIICQGIKLLFTPKERDFWSPQ